MHFAALLLSILICRNAFTLSAPEAARTGVDLCFFAANNLHTSPFLKIQCRHYAFNHVNIFIGIRRNADANSGQWQNSLKLEKKQKIQKKTKSLI